MEQEEYQKMFLLEKDHWWFRGKRKVIFSFVNKYYSKQEPRTILDVGCGTGIILKQFSKYGTPYGIDLSDDAINFCKQRGLQHVQTGTILNLPFETNSFDIVSVFDVLYHKGITNDEEALIELRRVLKPGGRLFLTDSAMKCLWSKHDEAVHARTRYSKKEIRDKLLKVGFKVEKVSYMNFFLFPAVFIIRKLNNLLNRGGGTDIEKTSEPLNSLLYSLFAIESSLMKYMSLPFGVSIFAVGKKE